MLRPKLRCLPDGIGYAQSVPDRLSLCPQFSATCLRAYAVNRNLIHLDKTCRILAFLAELEISCQKLETPTFLGKFDKILVRSYQDRPRKFLDSC